MAPTMAAVPGSSTASTKERSILIRSSGNFRFFVVWG